MSRVKLIFPEPILFETSIAVGIHNINYGGHLGNDSVLTIMHEARMQWFNSMGYQSEVGIVKNIGIIVTESFIQYKSEAFYGNDLKVEISISEQSEVGLEIFYRLNNITKDNITAIGRTHILFYNYQDKRISKMPDEFKNKLINGKQ